MEIEMNSMSISCQVFWCSKHNSKLEDWENGNRAQGGEHMYNCRREICVRFSQDKLFCFSPSIVVSSCFPYCQRAAAGDSLIPLSPLHPVDTQQSENFLCAKKREPSAYFCLFANQIFAHKITVRINSNYIRSVSSDFISPLKNTDNFSLATLEKRHTTWKEKKLSSFSLCLSKSSDFFLSFQTLLTIQFNHRNVFSRDYHCSQNFSDCLASSLISSIDDYRGDLHYEIYA